MADGTSRRFHVERPHLVDAVLAHPLALIEAPGGYGKTTLVRDALRVAGAAAAVATLDRAVDEPGVLAGSLRAALRRAGLSDLTAALDGASAAEATARLVEAVAARPDPVALVVDEAHHARGAAARWLADLADRLRNVARVVVAGRHLDGHLRALATRAGAVAIGAEELAFGREDLARSLPATSPFGVEQVWEATRGWPAAVSLLVAAPGPLPALGGLAPLLDRLLEAAGPGDAALLAALGWLPYLSEGLADEAIGPGALDRATELGLPLARRVDGWLELPGPVRDELRRRARPEPGVLHAAARHYGTVGLLSVAVGLLLDADDPDAVATLLAGLHWTALDQLGVAELTAVLDLLPDASVAAAPGALLAAARLAESTVGNRARADWLGRADRLLTGPGPTRRELDAERACDLARDGADEAAEALARAVLAGAPRHEATARARALSALGLTLAIRGDARSMLEAEGHLEASAALCRRLHEPMWEANALLRLGYGISFAAGALDQAVERLTRAAALLARADRQRARTLTFLAEVLTYRGSYDEAEVVLREVSEIGRRCNDHLVLAYGAWSWARWAAQQRRRDTTVDWLAEAERHPSDWYDHLTGVEFLAAAAELASNVGAPELARRYLDRAEARAEAAGHADIAWYARAVYEVRHGDPGRAARILEELADSPEAPRRERWHLLALRAQCAERLGDPAAVDLARRAFDAATLVGDDALVAVHEPEWVGARGAAPTPPARVHLLGRFEVVVGGVDATPPAGHPATLVKLVALRGVVALDEAVDALWPDADLATGRARLRNVLLRIRQAGAEPVVRDGELLGLAAGTVVDATAFEQEARVALATADASRGGRARRAMSWYLGDLLPGDRFTDWVAGPRERFRRRALEVLDLLAGDATERGDLDEAIRCLDRAVDIEPLDEHRYIRAATLLAGQGRRGTALDFVHRAQAMLDDLGLPHPEALRALDLHPS